MNIERTKDEIGGIRSELSDAITLTSEQVPKEIRDAIHNAVDDLEDLHDSLYLCENCDNIDALSNSMYGLQLQEYLNLLLARELPQDILSTLENKYGKI